MLLSQYFSNVEIIMMHYIAGIILMYYSIVDIILMDCIIILHV